MAVPVAQEFATGACTLPDVGQLGYNGVRFTALYKSHLSGRAVKDNAGWTTKWVEWTLVAEGVVTLQTGQVTTDSQWTTLRRLLTQTGGVLTYQGKGFGPLTVNGAGGLQDLNWGPKPEVLEFTPLGNSAGAYLKWTVTTCIPELFGPPSIAKHLVQFNQEVSVTYDEDAYASLVIKGTMEIGLNRTNATSLGIRPAVALARTVDDFRGQFLNQIAKSVDLTLYRVTRRTFNTSRDMRTMEWDFAFEQLPPMPMPPGATTARGSYSVKSTNMGFVSWVCALRATYNIRPDWPRRQAYNQFVALMLSRMQMATKAGVIPSLKAPTLTEQDPSDPKNTPAAISKTVAGFANRLALGPLNFFLPAGGDNGTASTLAAYTEAVTKYAAALITGTRPLLMTFEMDEGLYLDSKSVTFSASWRFVTTLSSILQASGMFTAPYKDNGQWALSVQDITGATGVLDGRIDRKGIAVIDFGVNL